MIKTQVNIGEEWPLAANFSSLGELATKLLPISLLVAGVIFFSLVVYAGFSMITAAGSDDAQAREKWKAVLTKGAIGLAIIFSAFWILQIINYITGGILDDLIG